MYSDPDSGCLVDSMVNIKVSKLMVRLRVWSDSMISLMVWSFSKYDSRSTMIVWTWRSRCWCWWSAWETVQGLWGWCVSLPRPAQVEGKVYRVSMQAIQKGIQGGGGKINSQWRGPSVLETELSKVTDAYEDPLLLIFKVEKHTQISGEEKQNWRKKNTMNQIMRYEFDKEISIHCY